MLSNHCPVLSVTLVYGGETAEWIKMPLGTDVGLSPGDIVLDRDPAPPTTERGTAAPSPYYIYGYTNDIPQMCYSSSREGYNKQ